MSTGSESKSRGSKISESTAASKRSESMAQKDVQGIDKDTQAFIRIVQSNSEWTEEKTNKYLELESKVYDKYENKKGITPTKLKSQEEQTALEEYQRWGFEDINSNLRQGKQLTSEQKQITQTLDKIMNRTKLRKDTIVYRGGSNSKLNKNTKAYTSTSTNPYQANRFTYGGRDLHAYRIPKGTNAIIIGGGEQEILLPRGFDLNKYKIM